MVFHQKRHQRSLLQGSGVRPYLSPEFERRQICSLLVHGDAYRAALNESIGPCTVCLHLCVISIHIHVSVFVLTLNMGNEGSVAAFWLFDTLSAVAFAWNFRSFRSGANITEQCFAS